MGKEDVEAAHKETKKAQEATTEAQAKAAKYERNFFHDGEWRWWRASWWRHGYA